MKTLEQFLKHHAEFAAHLFMTRGEVMAMWVAETKGGDILPIVTPLTDKDMILKAVRELFRQKQVARYVFMTEAWTVVAKKGREKEMTDYAESHSLSDHPDRREILMLSAEDGESQIMGHYYILRPEHGKPKLSPFEMSTHEASGRFMGLLKA